MADQDELAQVINGIQHRNCLHEPEPPTPWALELAQEILDSDFMVQFEIKAKAEVLRGQAREIRHNWADESSWTIAGMLEDNAQVMENDDA